MPKDRIKLYPRKNKSLQNNYKANASGIKCLLGTCLCFSLINFGNRFRGQLSYWTHTFIHCLNVYWVPSEASKGWERVVEGQVHSLTLSLIWSCPTLWQHHYSLLLPPSQPSPLASLYTHSTHIYWIRRCITSPKHLLNLGIKRISTN